MLTKKDWERIQGHLQPPPDRAMQAKAERERLQELSKQSVAGWSNTVQGQRKAKLEARKIRAAQKEEQQLQLDLEEARIQANKRKEAIKRARELQYLQTDRVKAFQGAALLTEVLTEREKQLGQRSHREQLVREHEARLHEAALEELKIKEEEEVGAGFLFVTAATIQKHPTPFLKGAEEGDGA